MPGVKVRENETFERAFRRFKRLCEKEKVRSEIKKHQRYEKPSEERQRKKKKVQRYRRK